MGTVMVTSVPVASRSGGRRLGDPDRHPSAGGRDRGHRASRRPGRLSPAEPREFVSLTVLFDHEVVDGVPVARFLRRLIQLMETAFELE